MSSEDGFLPWISARDCSRICFWWFLREMVLEILPSTPSWVFSSNFFCGFLQKFLMRILPKIPSLDPYKNSRILQAAGDSFRNCFTGIKQRFLLGTLLRNSSEDYSRNSCSSINAVYGFLHLDFPLFFFLGISAGISSKDLLAISAIV